MQRSELPMNIGSFMIVPTRGSRETVSGQNSLTGLTDRSNPEQCNKAQRMRNEVNKYEIFSHSRIRVEYIQSNSKDHNLNFNYLKYYLCFDQVCV